MASFLDQIAPDTGTAMDPLTGLPRTSVPLSPQMYGDDDGSPNYWGVQPRTSPSAAAAPASPAAAAGPTTSPMATSTRDDLLSGNEPGLNPAAISMGADAGDEVSVASRSFVADPRTMAYAPQGSAQGNAIDAIHAAQPNAQVFAAKNYNRVGGQDASQFMAGMSPAAQAAIQKLMSPRPDATATFNGQSFVMPGGNFVPAGAAMRAAQGADAQTAQAQELDQRAKADAYKQANSPAALQSLRDKDAQDLWKLQHPAPAPLTPGQQKLKDLQDANALDAATPAGQGYKDAQQLVGKLDITNPQHQPVISALQSIPKTANAIPAQTMQAAGQLLHPAPSQGQQVLAGLGGASKVLEQSPDLQQQLAQLAQGVTTGHLDTDGYWKARSSRMAIEQEMVRRGSDPTAAHLAVKAALQKAAPSFVQAPQQQGEFGRTVEDLGDLSVGSVLDPVGDVASLMARSHRLDTEEKTLKASFLNE